MRQYSVEEAIGISDKITRVATVLVSTAVAFVIGIILIKLMWAWTVPDLFPVAVEQGLVADNLSWLAAAKVATLAAILTSTGALVAGRWTGR